MGGFVFQTSNTRTNQLNGNRDALMLTDETGYQVSLRVDHCLDVAPCTVVSEQLLSSLIPLIHAISEYISK